MAIIDPLLAPRASVGLPAGTRLGRYEVIRLLSVGGMAEIYLARAEGIAGFEKLVVIKRMLPHFAVQVSYVQMFLAEARLAARLDHSNIVQVHDIGEETGNYYYAMEYLRGGDLRDLMRIEARAGRAMPIHCAVAIGLGLAAGLDHAHGLADVGGQPLGIVHRDVSLSNVLVSFDGAVKLTDFGVAKLASAERQTRTGTLKGKIGYMSPEQCRGVPLDRRSDLFSVGVILYELTTGRRLFAGAGTDLVVLQKIVGEDATPPTRLRADYPPALEAIVLRALQRDRRYRYQTARELQRDLEALARAEPLKISPIELGEYVTALLAPDAAAAAPTVVLEEWGDDVAVERIEREASASVSARSGGHEASRPVEAPLDLRRSVRRRTLAVAAVIAAGAAAALALVRYPGARAPLPAETALPIASVATAPEPTASWSPPPRPPAPAAAVRALPVVALAVTAPAVRDERRRPASPQVIGRPPAPAVRDTRRLVAAADPRSPAPADEPAAIAAPIDAGAPPIDAAAPVEPPAAARATPPPPAPPPAIGSLDATTALTSVDVHGPLQDSELRRGVERVLASFRQCYQQASRAAQRTPAGQVRIAFEIDETRAARSVRAGAAPLPGLGACLSTAAERIRTRLPPDVGTAQVTIVITFAPTP